MNLVVSFIDLIEDKEALCYMKEKEKLKGENLKLTNQKHKLESELKDLEQKYDKKNGEHEEIKKEIKDLCKQKSDLEKRIKNFDEEFMKQNKEELQRRRQKMKKKVTEQKKKFNELLLQYKELDGKYKSQSLELDNLKNELNSTKEDNKNLVAKIKILKEQHKEEKQALINLIGNLKGKISKRDHVLYCRLEEIKKDKKKYMEEVNNFLGKKINEFANHIKEVRRRIETRAKEASELFTKLRELCSNTISNINYINNEESFSEVKIDLNKSDINQIYIYVQEIIQRMNNAYLKLESEKEAEIERLEKDIVEHKETIESREDSIRDKEVELIEYINLLKQKEISLEEMKKENTKLTKAKYELSERLEDFRNNEINLEEKYNKLKEEKGKLKEIITALEGELKYLENENKRIKGESEVLNTKISRLRSTKATLEEYNTFKETEIKKLNEEIIELNTSIRDKEAKLMRYTSSLNKEKTSLEEMQEEKSKVDDNIKILEKDLKDLKDENEKVKRESEDLNNEILSLENTKTKLEKDNASLKEDLKNYKQGNKSLKKQIEEEQSKAEKLKKEIHTFKKREAELTSCIKNVKENPFKLIEDKLSVIKQIIIKTEERVINLDKRFKSVIETISEAKDNSKKEQSPSKQIDITKEDNQKERQKFILDIQSIIGEFELLKNKTQDLLANEVKATREVVITQFKGICQLIYQRELRLVKEIEGSYETAKEKLSTAIKVGNSITSKLNKLKPLMIKLKYEVPRRVVAKDYVAIDIIEEYKKEDNKSPVAESKGKLVREENKAKESKGICNIQLVDAIYPHEIFISGILKDVTKENLYEIKFIKLASQICCFCLKEKARQKAVCLYHSRCNKCLIKTKKDCILCQAFGFKPLDFACDHCKSIVSLPEMDISTCMHKKCNYCTKTGICKICNGMRPKLSVRVL